jgi:outer membrane protein insertion porin family
MGIRGVVFLDAGNAWGAEELMDPRVLRTSAGFGVRWNSPVGPLRFEWGFPLRPRPGEDRSMFEFTIGNSF